MIAASTATFVDPHVSIGQATVYETIALAKKSPMETTLRLAFTGRTSERLSAARAISSASAARSSILPSSCAPEAQALAEQDRAPRPATARHDEARAVGGAGTSVTDTGTAIVSFIEPAPGYAREFNRWYEDDHFPQAVLAGPGVLGGARFVATRACKAVRPPHATLFGDPQRGSYLGVAFVAPGMQAEWDAWVLGRWRRSSPRAGCSRSASTCTPRSTT